MLRIAKRSTATMPISTGMGKRSATPKLIQGVSVSRSCATKASTSSPPPARSPTTRQEFSQSNRLPWSSAAYTIASPREREAMPNQSGRCSRTRFTGSRGMPRTMNQLISSAIGTDCQKIQRQSQYSV